ncbi:GSCOCG00002694001-RA-CDS, partial [Cotesia congregata]
MVFVNFLGVIFYLAAGCALLYTAPVKTWGRLASFMLCFLISVVHTITFLTILLIWRHRFSAMRKCHPVSYGQYFPGGPKMFTQNGSIMPENCTCGMAAVPTQEVESHEANTNVDVYHKPQYPDRPHSERETSSQKSLQYRENLNQTTCDICHRPLPEVPQASESIGEQLETTQLPLAQSSPRYSRRSSSPRSMIPSATPVHQNIQSVQFCRGPHPICPAAFKGCGIIPTSIVVKSA